MQTGLCLFSDMRPSPVSLALRILLLIMASMGTAAQPISTPTGYRQQPFDVISYTLDATIAEPSTRMIRATVVIRVAWTVAATDASFPVHLRDLTIDSARLDGTRLQVVDEGQPADATYHHRIVLNRTTAPGDTLDIVVDYSGTMTAEPGTSPWGGVHYQDNVLYAMGVGFSANYVSTTQHWLACYDHPSDKATFDATFRVPRSMVAASVGRHTDVDSSGPLSVWHWKEDHPAATYLLTFAVGPFAKLDLGTVDDIPQVAYVLRRDTMRSKVSYGLVPRMTATFARRFVPYPFDKVGYVNTQLGAMEHQTLISFPVVIAQRQDTVNSTAAHELAHLWFGDYVSPQDFRHAWLTESFATFCEALWSEELSGRDEYLRVMEDKARQYIRTIAPGEGIFPLYDFPRQAPSSNYPQTIYQKGAVVVGMLRAILGDSIFFDGMRTYLRRHAYGNATSDDMRNVLEEVSGRDLSEYWNDWILGMGWPRITTTLIQETDRWRVRVSHIATDALWPDFHTLPLNVTYRNCLDPNAGADCTVDTVFTMDRDIEFFVQDPSTLRINSGTKCRSLVEVATVTSIGMEERGGTASHDTMTLAPNPVHDDIVVRRSTTKPASAAVIEIVDMNGRIVQSTTIGAGQERTRLTTTGLPAGSYIVRMSVDGKAVLSAPFTRSF